MSGAPIYKKQTLFSTCINYKVEQNFYFFTFLALHVGVLIILDYITYNVNTLKRSFISYLIVGKSDGKLKANHVTILL